MIVRAAQLLLGVLAAFGLLCAAALLTGRVPASVLDGAPPAGAADDCDCGPARAASDAEPKPGGDGDATGRPATAVEGTAPTPTLQRYRICERGEALPRLQALDGGRWLVHCGPSLYLLAFDGGSASALTPRRLGRFTAPPGPAGELPMPAPALAMPLTGGESTDLVLSSLLVDASSAAVGGALHLARSDGRGGWQAPQRLLTLAPGALVGAELDGQAPRELVALNLGAARTARAAELWLVAGGPAPLRRGKLTALPTTRTITALDLDGDGRDELCALSPDVGQLQLWPSSERDAETLESEPLALALPGARELLAADTDGDGKRELFALGQSLWRVTLDGTGPQAQVLAKAGALRDIFTLDVDADGRPELLGYAHPHLQRLGPEGGAKTLLELQGEGLSIVSARLTHLDGDGRADLLVLGTGDALDGWVELAVSGALGESPRVKLASTSTPLANAPLHLHDRLR